MFTHICGNWHFWQANGFIASDESRKQLRTFASADDCINWLYANGFKNEARSLHAARKAKG